MNHLNLSPQLVLHDTICYTAFVLYFMYAGEFFSRSSKTLRSKWQYSIVI